MWLTIIKYTHSRSLFKALKMLCFNKYKSNLRTLRGKTWRDKMFSIILWSSLTSQNKKDIHLLIDAAAGSCLIVLLFHSFESSSKRSHLFQNEWILNLVITLPAVLHAPPPPTPKWIPKGINQAFYAQNPAVTPISQWHT